MFFLLDIRRYAHWLTIAGIVSLATISHGEDNLLANGCFEELSGAAPARWDVYVKPLEGATGKLVPEAHGGKYAVQLQVSTAYEKDPVNNWSQNIVGEFGGLSMRLHGYIKVQEATDAAIWAQCWRKSPLGVISVASTGMRAPVYGTKDWDEVFVDFDVPQKTDFITIRCVLKGTGTAWFDDISLTETGGTPKKPEISRPAPPHSSELEAPMASLPIPGNSTGIKKPPKSTLGDQIREDAEMLRLREENKMLKDTVKSLKSSNEDLQKRMKVLEEKPASK